MEAAMRALTLALVVSLSVLLVGSAQIEVGGIAGTVNDVTGAAIPGVTVQAKTRALAPATRITNARGEFSFERMPVGDYDITASLEGFATFRARVTVQRSATARIAIELRIGALTETVSVASAAPSTGQSYSRAARSDGRDRAPRSGRPRFNTESYDRIDDNPFKLVSKDPLSTFSIDVDTASYANVRRFLNQGQLPPADAVRIEELLNYFRFDYPRPGTGAPFSMTAELGACPWNAEHKLALVGLQSAPIADAEIPPRNLVFLLDVSGSMADPDKLPLVQAAMRMLVDTLTERDRIAIVVYAGASGLVLPATGGADKQKIHEAIARLEAGGSTNGAAGITLAYQVAQEQFVKPGINRVILATDGDFNVGVSSQGELTRLIEEKRATGIFLSVLGVGTGNVKDSTMEKLADRGNGNYAYLDSLHEARKVLVREAGATLVTVAKDVKIQVEFNPSEVAAYRLIGYENRLLIDQDFNDDRKDAGEIGAGHTVTALYEIVPAGARVNVPAVDPLKYQRPAAATGTARGELMTVKVRYKEPDGNRSRLLTFAVPNRPSETAVNLGFASAVAEFGMLLRRSEHRGRATFEEAATLARRFRGADSEGYRAEFVRLVELAGALTRQASR
jgi:Ca-activated chloride channel family protein